MKFANYGVLNVVAHPHPKGTYRKLFELAASMREGVNFRADQHAKTSKISDSEDGIFSGRIAVWTAIDREAKTIQTDTLVENPMSDTNFKFPDNLGFNSKIFSFAFREKDHLMYVELVNEEGKSISAGVVRKIMSSIFDAIKPDDIDNVTVHIVSRKNAVDQILAMDELLKIEILLELPNPDDLEEEKMRVIRELQEMGAKRKKTELVKAPGKQTLVLIGDYQVEAELAKDNGYVKATGRIEGVKTEQSTKDYPEEIQIELLPNESSAVAVRRIARAGREA